MARGDKKRVLSQSTGMANTAENLAGNASTNAANYLKGVQGFEGSLLPQYQQIAQHPGYTPQQQGAIGTAAQEGVGSAYGSAQEALARRAARTRNAAGMGEMSDVLARQKAKTMGETGAGLQQKFADTAMQQKMQALEGMGQLYGIDSRTLAMMMGMPAEDIRAGASALSPGAEMAAQPTFWDTFTRGLGSGLSSALTGGRRGQSTGDLSGME